MSRKNYTEKEKRELLTIVDKYKAIIENKSTNAVTVEKKNFTWERIAQEYNSSAENPRSAKQLNTAYQNLKRLTRQKTADDNMQNYVEKKIQNDLKKFKKDKAEDKKAIMATGGGTFTPVLSEVGAQMLALMGEQIRPLSNTCDSATDYFRKDGDEDFKKDENVIIIETIHEFDNHKMDTVEIPVVEKILSAEPPLDEGCSLFETVPPPKVLQKKKPLSSRPSSSKIKNNSICLKPKKIIENTNSIKRKFYQKKLESAVIEKKTNLINYKISLKKQKLIDIEIKIKEAELNFKEK